MQDDIIKCYITIYKLYKFYEVILYFNYYLVNLFCFNYFLKNVYKLVHVHIHHCMFWDELHTWSESQIPQWPIFEQLKQGKLYGTAKQSKSKCCLFFVYMHSMHIFHCIVCCMTGS